ncbi:unnamed protein product [Paramecium sonneborni]|uniref:Uncharacterized protein n=1 Tax=Paramecium sonneborni TaxID=65129 RepID=A0A8S1N8A0_9CILI|nr:unnamed protein product [Paramecium sonneborni]
MLQIEIICFGLAVEVQRLQDLTQQLKQDIHQANQLNKTHLNTIDQNNLDIQHLTRKLDLLNRSKNQIEQDYNQILIQHDYLIDIISQITGDELTLEELTELIEELKKRSLKYDQFLQLLNGQEFSDIISKSQQFLIQYQINQELKDQLQQLQQYPQIVICLNQDIQKLKHEILNLKLLINQLTQQNKQLQDLIHQSKSIQDQRLNSDLQSDFNLLSTSQPIQQESIQKQIIELENKLNSAEQQNKSLKDEISSILNLKIQMEAKLRNSILDQNKLLNEKEKLTKETFQLVNQSNNFKTELQNKQETNVELTNQISLLQTQIKNKENQFENLLKQNKDSENKKQLEINNLNQQLQKKTIEINQLNLQIQLFNDETKKLNEELQNSIKVNKNTKQFSQQIEIIQDKQLSNKNIMQMQDTQLQLLQKQSINDKNDLENSYIQIIEQQNQENSKLKFEIDQLKNNIQQLEDQIIEFQVESKESKDLLDAKNIEIDKLVVFNKKIQESNQKHFLQNQELEQQIRQLQFKFSSFQKFNTENSRSSDYFKSTIIDKIKSENQQFQQDIYKLNLLNQELIEQITSMKFEINNYQIQITKLTMQIENAQFKFQEESQQEINYYKQQHQLIITQINDLQGIIVKQQQKLSEQDNEIQKFQNDDKMYEKKFKAQENEIDEQEFFIRQLQQELNQLSSDLTKIEDKLEIVQQEKEKKIQENIDLTNQIIKFRSEQKYSKEQIESQITEQIQGKIDCLLFEKQELNQQICEKNSLLEQKCLLIDKFNLKIMNQNIEIFQLRQQVTQYENQIIQFQHTIEKPQLGNELEYNENIKLNEVTQLNIKLSQVIDEKEQKILSLKYDLQVSQNKLDEIEKINQNLIIKLNEKQQLLQSQSEQISQSQISSETLISQNVEKNHHQQQIQILQKKYDDVLKENEILTNNSSLIEEYKNKIALLSLEVSRYHNSKIGQPSQNFRQNTRVENHIINNTKSLSQGKESIIRFQQGVDNNYKDHDLYCLLVLSFAEIESLRTKDDEKKNEDKSKVQRIIDYYRQKAQ